MTYRTYSKYIGFLLLLVVGCGSGDLVEISGEVAYCGQPVNKGTIAFLPADGKGPTAAGTIADGRYSVKTSPGPKEVRIEGFKVLRQQHYMNDPNLPLIDVTEQYLPERYNANSELSRNIASDVSVYDFTLDK
jgi:hypothetical protein